MKRLFLVILFLLFAGIVQADSNVIFTWDKSPESDLKEYRLYQSDTSGDYVPGVDIPVAVIPAGTETVSINVSDGETFWVITAIDKAGNEAKISNEVTATLDTTAPNPVGGLNITIIIKVMVE